MKSYVQMIVVLTLITLISGLALGGLHQMTYERAQNNILKYKKIPAVADIYEVVSGELEPPDRLIVEEGLLTEKRFLDIGDDEPVLMFVIRKDGEPYAAALEDYGQGFGGDLGVMVGFELDTGSLVGIGITTMAETPGIGTKVKDDSFTAQFRGLGPDSVIKVKKDGGQVDAITGATISSRAVAQAIERARSFYDAHRARVAEAAHQPPEVVE
ncbi:MAG: RnfABCDGE type electron transport complex subunit G [Acidobacteriota bacterium]|nr:MAG: RnfABCDGE type electron transport complex subunit G [Acidobacteriota bacterium]